MNDMSRPGHPKAGDVLTIHGHRLAEPERLAEILEVLGRPDHAHFRVRWDDGHESILYPGNDATVRVQSPPSSKRSPRRKP